MGVGNASRVEVAMKPQAIAVAGLLAAGAGALGYVLRDELTRYARIVRMDQRPELVGASVTPQGNAMALGSSEQRRERDRVPGGVEPGKVITTDGRWAG